MIKPAIKIQNLPPYIFSRIKVLAQEARKKNLDVIDLSMGNPDMSTPGPIVDRLVDTVSHHTNTLGYPQAKGMPKFRKGVAEWMKKRFGLTFDPNSEILALIGSKEGIANLSEAYLEPGDTVLVPTPCYPVHFFGAILAEAKVQLLPINENNNYLPELDKIPEEVAKRARILFLNYPNNPTTAVLSDMGYLKDVVQFAKTHDILVCFDNAYSEIAFDDYRPPSFFQVEGAREVGIEFHSFSKTYNMAGWRVGWACGSKELLGPLEKYKSYTDYGVPTFIQLSAIKALELWPDTVKEISETYRRRRDYLCDGLNRLGWGVTIPKATMYLWAKIPEPFQKMGSLKFCEDLVLKTGIALSPGVGFGQEGENYVRISLVTRDSRFYDALLRLKKYQGVKGVTIKEPKK
jgi:LL-diaminopimelate aminotransferase